MNRSVGLCILFTILTCGIYGIYWFYKITEELNYLSDDHSLSPGLGILFSIITCGLYTIYWSYKVGKNMQLAQQRAMLNASDDSVLYLFLSIFGLSIIVFAIVQSNMNTILASQKNMYV